MYSLNETDLALAITENVKAALFEDVGCGDINAQLIPADKEATASIIARQSAVLCGQRWVEALFQQLDPLVELEWYCNDGDQLENGSSILRLSGNARSLLRGERAALNFLQCLSSTATRCAALSALIEGTRATLLDTRKTLPGLRLAQKFAMVCGGGASHRMGLYDGFLIKENHIAACGGIAEAVASARLVAPGKIIEVEVETLEELEQALAVNTPVIMLDNFSLEDTYLAVQRVAGGSKLEASGGVNEHNLRAVAETGVDYISLGTLTKDIQAIDLSMRLIC